MEKFPLKDLLALFLYEKVTPEEFRKLKEIVKRSPNGELDGELKSIWDEMDSVASMNREIKAEVLANIHLQMLSGNKRIFFRRIKMVAAVLLSVIISLGSYFYFSGKYRTIPEEFIIMAEGGQKTKILLPDGTRVWLNSDSKLSYASDFNRNNRLVKLDGEAFFEVEKNTDINFTVETECVNVVVHGTAFNVSAYKKDPVIEISLLKGVVRLAYPDNTLITGLYPNQIASISKKNMKWKVQSCDAEMECLWTQNKLKFENAPAAEVFRKLERWYGVNISVENMNEKILYGFTLKSESLREILYEINKITPIVYKINGEEASITYK
ncbi:MAG: FecR family protein [Tannerella sp.]|jgi:ferric-dicitrate binding protein FerR (iron transport regulator)|nr:FecR family protein [Tannerella sp.]